MINENMPHVQVKHTFDQWVDLGISVQWYGEGCHREVAKNMDFILLQKVLKYPPLYIV